MTKGPLIIPALPNKDWRAAAKEAAAKRRKGYIPDEGKMKTGADGSQGGMGIRDTINAGPQQAGLVIYKKRKLDNDQDSNFDLEGQAKMETDEEEPEHEEPLSAEQLAVNALLYAAKQANGEAPMDEMPVAAIPMAPSTLSLKGDTETEAYRDDVASRPDSATLDDYKRMPVSQFGTALLMGMGWKPGMGASKTGKGPSEAIVPKARPALLGLGAKPQEVVEGSKSAKPSKRYVPVMAVARGDSSRSDKGGGERSRSDKGSDRERDREKDRRDGDRRDRDRSERRESDRSRDRPESDRDRDYDRRRRDDGRERDRDRDRRDDRRDRDKDDSRKRK